MARYQIQFNNGRRFDAAFYDTECSECNSPIYEGDPLGKLNNEEGYLCLDCLQEDETPATVKKYEG